MSTPETAKAAADLAEIMLATAAAQGDENAARLLTQSDDGPVAEAPNWQKEPLVSSPTPAAETAPEAPAAPQETITVDELVDLDPNLSDDLAALLTEPDFDEEAAAEVAAEYDAGEVEYDPDEQKRVRALEKRNAWLEQQVVNANKGKWVNENLRAYPLLAMYAPDEVKAINATSRRAFAREAAALQEKYAKALKPALEDLNKAKELLKGQAVVEARQEVASAWGNPVTDAGGTAPDVQAAELERARQQHAPLRERLKILMGTNPRG